MQTQITINELQTEGMLSLHAICEINDYDVDEMTISYSILWAELEREDDTCVELDEEDILSLLNLQDQSAVERLLLEEIMYG